MFVPAALRSSAPRGPAAANTTTTRVSPARAPTRRTSASPPRGAEPESAPRRSGVELVVELLDPPRCGFDRELRPPALTAGAAHRLGTVPVGEEPRQRGCQGIGVLGIHEQARLAVNDLI